MIETDNKYQILDCTINVISPVHVGNGNELGKFDFFVDAQGCINIVDFNALCDRVKNNPKAINELTSGNISLEEIINNYRVPTKIGDVIRVRYLNPNPKKPFRILEMIRDGNWRPMVPGTSLKGAIRTAFLWHYLSMMNKTKMNDLLESIIEKKWRLKEEMKNRDADNILIKEIFGEDPNHDILRSLHVGDAYFPSYTLELFVANVMSLGSENGKPYLWKDMRERKNINNRKHSTMIFFEGIQQSEQSTFRIKIDKFLFSDFANKFGLPGFKRKSFNAKDLFNIVNKHAEEHISTELEFYEKCNFSSMVSFYRTLQERLEKNKNKNVFLLHLGWGTGWKCKTGDYLSNKQLVKFRKAFKMGKKNFPVFPKTRKVIDLGNGDAAPGWVSISVNDQKIS